MVTTADGKQIVAADPERDQIYFVDAVGMNKLHTRELNGGDEPGRVVEDAAGRIHVVLRGANAIATLGTDPDSTITRRDVCAVPRGIAYDRARDQLHIACGEGKLLTLKAAPAETTPVRTLRLDSDLRDVLVRDDKLFVSRFRAAELIVLSGEGDVLERHSPARFASVEARNVAERSPTTGVCSSTQTMVNVESIPNVAWRVIDVPAQGVTMLHQRSRTEEIQITRGGYGNNKGCGGGIVEVSMTKGLDTDAPSTADLKLLALAVDIAADPSGQLLAVVAPGNHGGLTQVEIEQLQFGSEMDLESGPISDDRGLAPCMTGRGLPDPQGQATAVTFVSADTLAVQTREPAAISFYDLHSSTLRKSVSLDNTSTLDTGHTVFHVRTGAGLACASCHPEAGDDGHVWTFQGIGPRRTQTLRGGLLGTEPLHWNGDMKDFSTLMSEVFVGRMSGFQPSAAEAEALADWLDSQPALHAPASDTAAAERGRLLFESTQVGCATCHAGDHLTNNMTVNVNTGADLQVPSLKGVRFRSPLMHDGCAADLKERLTDATCGGGDDHGHTSQLSPEELSDLVAYLETL